MCSRSMFVTTDRIGESLRNDRSLSSASAIRYCDLPSRAFEPIASTRPPTTTVGSRPPAARTGDVRGSVSLENGRAQRSKPLGDRRMLPIRAGNLVAKIQQHLGDPTHADAANAHEMYALNLAEHEN